MTARNLLPHGDEISPLRVPGNVHMSQRKSGLGGAARSRGCVTRAADEAVPLPLSRVVQTPATGKVPLAVQ